MDIKGKGAPALQIRLGPAWATAPSDERAYWDTFYDEEPGRLPRRAGELAQSWAPRAAKRICELGLPRLVVDVGCGAGQDLAHFEAVGLSTVGIDLSVSGLRAATHPAAPRRLIAADLRQPLPLDDDSVGCVHSRFVLSCGFSDLECAQLVGELGRILAPGGLALISVRSTSDPTYLAGGQPSGGRLSMGGVGLHFFSARRLRALFAGWVEERLEGRAPEHDEGVGSLELVASLPAARQDGQ